MSERSPNRGNAQATEPGPGMSAHQSRRHSEFKERGTVSDLKSVFNLSGRRRRSAEESRPPPPRRGCAPHAERLRWLQTQRTAVGLWVACDNERCNKFRFLKDTHDPMQLPDKWYCRMNPDSRYATCTAAEVELAPAAEEDLLHATASAGSVVWARMRGFPRWPALVDDDPDTEQFYWLGDFSDIPTYYHVVFFDAPSRPVERAWVAAADVGRYEPTAEAAAERRRGAYGARLAAARRQADAALPLAPAERLRRFSFVSRYRGVVDSPRSFTRRELLAFGQFTDESSSDDEPSHRTQAPPPPAPAASTVPELSTAPPAGHDADCTELYMALVEPAQTRVEACDNLGSVNELGRSVQRDPGSDDFEFE